MTKKDHEKIWKEINPSIDTIEAYMNAFIHLAQDLGREEDDYRLTNLKRTFCRGIMIAASSKYLPVKNKPNREGYDFNAPAIVYCYEQLYKDIREKNIAAGAKVVPTDADIHEEAKNWTFLGIHPEITDAAIKAYNEKKDYTSTISVFIKDKSLDFNAPAVKAVKGFFKKLF